MDNSNQVGWVVKGKILRIGDSVFDCTKMKITFDDWIRDRKNPRQEVKGVTILLPGKPFSLGAEKDCLDYTYDQEERTTSYTLTGRTMRLLEELFEITPRA